MIRDFAYYLKSSERDRMCKQLTMVVESLPERTDSLKAAERSSPGKMKLSYKKYLNMLEMSYQRVIFYV